MSRLKDQLAAALLELSENFNTMLASMHRTNLRLLEALEAFESRDSSFDASTLSDDQVAILANRLAEPLWDYSFEGKVNDIVNGALDDLDVELDDLELSVSVDRASIRLTGRP